MSPFLLLLLIPCILAAPFCADKQDGQYCMWSTSSVLCLGAEQAAFNFCNHGCIDGACVGSGLCAWAVPVSPSNESGLCLPYLLSLPPGELVINGLNYALGAARAAEVVASFNLTNVTDACNASIVAFVCSTTIASCSSGATRCQAIRKIMLDVCGSSLPLGLATAACVDYVAGSQKPPGSSLKKSSARSLTLALVLMMTMCFVFI